MVGRALRSTKRRRELVSGSDKRVTTLGTDRSGSAHAAGMSERPFLPDPEAARRTRLRDFGEMLRLMAAGRGRLSAALDAAALSASSERAKLALRAAVAAGVLGDAGSQEAFASLGTAFIGSLAGISIFDTIGADARRVPARTRIAVAVTGFAGSEINEGAAIPVTRAAFSVGNGMPQHQITALTVATSELLRWSGAGELLGNELRLAIAAASDAVFLAGVSAATVAIPSTGDSAADLDALLAAVTLKTASRPFLVFEPAAAKQLCNVRGSGGGATWPEMTPTGGRMAGVPTLVSDQLGAGDAVLIDARGLAADPGEVIGIDSSGQADVAMDERARHDEH